MLSLGSGPESPLRLDLQVAAFDGIDQPGLLRKIDVQVAGTRRQHNVKAGAEVAGKNALAMAAEGGDTLDQAILQSVRTQAQAQGFALE